MAAPTRNVPSRKSATRRTTTTANKGRQDRAPPRDGSSNESRYTRRQCSEISCMECQENADEEYLFCDDCGTDHPGECPEHGPLTHIKDTEVEEGDPLRANKTIPEGLSIRRSTIKGAQYGVFTLKPLPKRVYFGPYEGVIVNDDKNNGYIWEVCKNSEVFLVDGRPLDRSNWMRYVNCAASPREQNLVAYMHHGCIYYRTFKAVGAGDELLVWYGTAFARALGLVEKSRSSRSPMAGSGNSSPASPMVFSCDTCRDLFSSHDLLEKHLHRKHPQRPQGRHRCAYCPYSSDHKNNVTSHERTHTGERPFVCHVCRKGFTGQGNLARHLLVHSGERQHECADCGQRFSLAHNLASHRRVQHSVEGAAASHLCPRCGKGFSRKGSLTTHMMIHTQMKPHACTQCEKKFTQRIHAQMHERIVHGRQYPLQCPHCGKGFTHMGKMRSHVRAHHSFIKEGKTQCSDER